LLVVGGEGDGSSSELWWPNACKESGPSCSLPSIPIPPLVDGPTVDLVDGHIIACFNKIGQQLSGNSYPKIGWQNSLSLLQSRRYHTSAVVNNSLLLVGGADSKGTTELVSLAEDGNLETTEHFSLELPRYSHCSIRVGYGSMILTGGRGEEYNLLDDVTEFFNIGGPPEQVTVKHLPALITTRKSHACGSYALAGGQMLIVTGGTGPDGDIASTEVMWKSGEGGWRKVGALPTPRMGVTAASVDGILHISGGWANNSHTTDAVLSWDPVSEAWLSVGHLQTPRLMHSMTEVPLSVVQKFC